MTEQFTNLQTGTEGEDLAEKHLLEKGFTILRRNWRAGRSEIDLVACRGNTVHFVEVKTRRTFGFGQPEHRVNKAKLKQMKMAAEVWLFRYPEWKFIQFDIISIQIDQPTNSTEIFMIEDIF